MPYSEIPQSPQTMPQPIPQAAPQQGSLNVSQFINSARQQGVPDQQIYQFLQQNGGIPQPQQSQEGAQLHDTGSLLGNVANSAGNFLGGLGNAITHPIQTIQTLGKTALGLGGQATNTLGLTNFSGSNIQAAQNFENFYKQRYGSWEDFTKTLKQDPVGVLADASAILDLGGGAVGKIGDLSKIDELSKAGQLVSKAGDITNPINTGAQAAGKILSPVTDFAGRQAANVLGATTGAGGSSVREAFNAAREGDPSVMSAARGNVSELQIIQTAQDALDKLKQTKNTTYQQQLQKIKGVEGEMDYTPMVQEFRTQLENNGIKVKGGTLDFENARGFQNPSEQAVLQNAYDKVERWGDLPNNNTLYGLDTLKQQLGDFYEQANGKAKPVIASTKTALSDLLKQNSEYKNLVEPYESTSNIITDLKNNLSLGAKNPETILKKLTQAVKQDNEFRQSFIDELSKSAPNGENIKAQLAGLNLKSLTNTGKLSTFLEWGPVVLHPTLWPTLLASSPRLVAEFMNSLGFSASKIDSALKFIKANKGAALANVAGRVSSIPQDASKAPSTSPAKRGILVKMPIK